MKSKVYMEFNFTLADARRAYRNALLEALRLHGEYEGVTIDGMPPPELWPVMPGLDMWRIGRWE